MLKAQSSKKVHWPSYLTAFGLTFVLTPFLDAVFNMALVGVVSTATAPIISAIACLAIGAGIAVVWQKSVYEMVRSMKHTPFDPYLFLPTTLFFLFLTLLGTIDISDLIFSTAFSWLPLIAGTSVVSVVALLPIVLGVIFYYGEKMRLFGLLLVEAIPRPWFLQFVLWCQSLVDAANPLNQDKSTLRMWSEALIMAAVISGLFCGLMGGAVFVVPPLLLSCGITESIGLLSALSLLIDLPWLLSGLYKASSQLQNLFAKVAEQDRPYVVSKTSYLGNILLQTSLAAVCFTATLSTFGIAGALCAAAIMYLFSAKLGNDTGTTFKIHSVKPLFVPIQLDPAVFAAQGQAYPFAAKLSLDGNMVAFPSAHPPAAAHYAHAMDPAAYSGHQHPHEQQPATSGAVYGEVHGEVDEGVAVSPPVVGERYGEVDDRVANPAANDDASSFIKLGGL